MDFQNKTHLLYFIFCIALILIRMPFIGKVFKVFYTAIHELGHAIVTVFTSGEIISINLFSDTSGNTITKSKGKFGQFLIAIAGYPIAAAISYLFFFLIFKEKISIVLFIFAGIALIELVFWLRNLYGIIWVVSFVFLLFFIYKMDNPIYCYVVTVFFTSILLVESFISTIQLVFISFKNPKNAGDATNLAKITHIPVFLWALLFFSISAFIVYLIIKLFFM